MPLLSFVVGETLEKWKQRENIIVGMVLFIIIVVGSLLLYPVISKDGKIVHLNDIDKVEILYNHSELVAGNYFSYNNGVDMKIMVTIYTNNSTSMIEQFSRDYNFINFEIRNIKKGNFYTFPLIFIRGIQ